MATKWIVKTKKGANIFPTYREMIKLSIGKKKYKSTVTQYDKKGNYIKISKNEQKWVSISDLKKVSKNTEIVKNVSIDEDSSSSSKSKSSSVENKAVAKGNDNYTTANKKTYNKLILKYSSALGAPPSYNSMVDPHYGNDIGGSIGRAVSELYGNPSLISLCPGTVDYLPGFSKKNKNTFFKYVKSSSSGDKELFSKIKNESKLNGQLYGFKSRYTKYINVVNALCRMASLYMGVGDETMPGTKTKLKNFDYGYYSTPDKAKTKKGMGIFAETKKVLNTAVSDSAYIHFFVNNTAPSVDESIRTTTTKSALEEAFNESGISSAAKNLSFLMGGTMDIDDTAENDLSRIIKDAGSSGNFIKSFAKLAKNYIKGGRLVFPEMIDDVGYEHTISCTMTFSAIYGNPKAIFLRCVVPTLHILAMSTPLQVSGNMYTYPFLCRAVQTGNFNTDLAVITNARIKRGGNDDMNWTTDGLSTEFEVTFDITPLYSKLMASSTAHPFLFLQNTSMMEYLAVMCGVDMKANNLKVKKEIAKMAITRSVKDTPVNLMRGIIDTKLMNNISNLIKLKN